MVNGHFSNTTTNHSNDHKLCFKRVNKMFSYNSYWKGFNPKRNGRKSLEVGLLSTHINWRTLNPIPNIISKKWNIQKRRIDICSVEMERIFFGGGGPKQFFFKYFFFQWNMNNTCEIILGTILLLVFKHSISFFKNGLWSEQMGMIYKEKLHVL
jgi:hypothetical protein